MKTTKNKTADLVQSKKGFFLRYSSDGMTHTFNSRDEAIEFAKKNQIVIKNL